MKLNKSLKPLIIILIIALTYLWANSSYAYDPDAVRSYNQGVDLSKNGNYQEAVLLFRKAITTDPSFTDAYYNLGSLYEYLGNKDKALESYEELVKRDSNDDETVYKVGYIYFQRTNYKKALDYLSLVSSSSTKYIESQRLIKKANLKISELNAVQKASQTIAAKTAPKKVEIPAKKELSKVVIKSFNGPTGITKDSKDNLYVANYIENSVVQISPNGKRTLIAKGAPINGPIGLAADYSGNIYVASYLSNEIVKINPQGKIISVLKGINKPYYIYIDKSGILYISEQGTNTVIKLKI
ncbi:MAG: tetratricopeptide repeat protein [Candidatus Gastranaerophilales bacterium]|nr:tetratricopeptide repeat protein [Candidatus Gastranaerophilales bacterium]